LAKTVLITSACCGLLGFDCVIHCGAQDEFTLAAIAQLLLPPQRNKA
jgi:hypothetical protein